MTTTTHASATIQRDGWTRLVFPWHPQIVEELKLRIPGAERRWVPERKYWTVTRRFSDLGIGIVRAVYPEITVVTERLHWGDNEPKPPPIRKTDPSFAALHLLPSAPPELIDAAYRCLARLNHPDTGGSTATMQRLNAAHDTLKARRSA